MSDSRDWVPPPGFRRLYRLYRRQQKLVSELINGRHCLREHSRRRAQLRRLEVQIWRLERVLTGGAP